MQKKSQSEYEETVREKNCNDGLPARREGLSGDDVRAFFLANNWRREMMFPRSHFRSHDLIGAILLRTRSKICGPYQPLPNE
jgi:hypothetical protein